NGAVILFHDHNNRSNTIEALPHIIKILKKSGYKFVTLSEWEKRVCNTVKARSVTIKEGKKVRFEGMLCGQKTKSLTAEHSY
ncbi:MAG: polysaccharide deacetylase family protein, partial [Wolbachia pipientis]